MAGETPTYDCVIVGGGFTGLAAAITLLDAGKTVAIVERDSMLGGLASGFDVGGHELEKFYHHWFTSDTHINRIAGRIGRGDRIVTRQTRTGMYYAGNFFRLSTPMDLLRFTAIPLMDRIRTGLATLAVRRVKDWKQLEAISAKDWLLQHFGKTAYKVVWEPLLAGKFGADADEVSAVWFWNKLALRGSSRGKGGGEELAYYKGGFAQLARDIGDYIVAAGGKVMLDCEALAVDRSGGAVEVETSRGVVRGLASLVTTPLPHAAKILERGTSAAYAESLRRIRYLGNVCLVLEMTRSLSELYWLNVNDPSFPYVGIIEHTNFEPRESYGGRHIVYLSKYLPVTDALYQMTPEQVFEYSLPHIQRMFPAFDRSWVTRHHVWRAPYAQPIVEKHYSRLIPDVETPIEGVFLSTMAQVYPEDRGTNYAVREGDIVARQIIESLGVRAPVSVAREPIADAIKLAS